MNICAAVPSQHQSEEVLRYLVVLRVGSDDVDRDRIGSHFGREAEVGVIADRQQASAGFARRASQSRPRDRIRPGKPFA